MEDSFLVPLALAVTGKAGSVMDIATVLEEKMSWIVQLLLPVQRVCLHVMMEIA